MRELREMLPIISKEWTVIGHLMDNYKDEHVFDCAGHLRELKLWIPNNGKGILTIESFNLPEPAWKFHDITLEYKHIPTGRYLAAEYIFVELQGVTPYMSVQDMVEIPIEFSYKYNHTYWLGSQLH